MTDTTEKMTKPKKPKVKANEFDKELIEMLRELMEVLKGHAIRLDAIERTLESWKQVLDKFYKEKF